MNKGHLSNPDLDARNRVQDPWTAKIIVVVLIAAACPRLIQELHEALLPV